MEQKLINNNFKQAPFGYAYHKLVLNNLGQPDDYIFVEINPAFEKLTGLKRDDILGNKVTEVIPDIRSEHFDWVTFYVSLILNDQEEQVTQVAELLGHWYKITAFPEGKDHIVTIFQDISVEAEQIEKLKQQKDERDKLSRDLELEILSLSYKDQLTGLYNRRYIEQKMKRSDTVWQLPVAIILGDVNGLKLTNDVFGHETGDRLLQKAAEAIKACCRKEDIVARWGGDEFLILMPETTVETTEGIIQGIKEKCLARDEGTLQLSVSLGCAVKTKEEANIIHILKEAEENMYHHKLLEGRSYRNIVINTLLATLFEKSIETEEHGERLKEYCVRIGRELKCSANELDELTLLAMLHDIGKIGIKDNILLKPSHLTVEEWVEMKKHPEIGYRIALNTPELSNVAEYILFHHEFWDGKGYPRGHKGEEIPLFCRILAVADAFDAMTNDRPYRKAMGREEAKAEIMNNSGTQFDPNIVEVFCNSLMLQ